MAEDFNEFNSWDCGGAATLLATVPAVLYFVFDNHDYKGAAVLSAVAVGVGCFVFIAAHLAGSRIVGRVLQLVGTVLCVAYWVYAIQMWRTHSRFVPPAPSDSAAPPPLTCAVSSRHIHLKTSSENILRLRQSPPAAHYPYAQGRC